MIEKIQKISNPLTIIAIFAGLAEVASTNALAQTTAIYTPLEVQQAYKVQTRSADGKPGKNYWQNRSEYQIAAEIDTANHTLSGSETIRYYNNSPDTLDQLIIRLYQDVNKIGNPRDYDTPKADINDGMNITRLVINNKALADIHKLDRYGTNLYLPLPDKLSPGNSLSLSIGWNYPLATESPLRGSGKSRDNTYFISYWYPQVAVYDDISGWDEYEYKGLAEFYNDFSDYDVRITVPNEFVIWATGELQNPHEVLSPKYYERYDKAILSDTIISVINADDRKNGGITAQNDRNTWYFKAVNVPDFAFGACDDYVWDLTSLVVDKHSDRRAIIGAAYAPGSQQLSQATALCRSAIDYLSNDLPGVPYPFPVMTVFQGTSAMEYPMMVNIRAYQPSREWLFISTLIHEVVHSYFPFYMGINERKYAFMDEGWAHMLPLDLQTEAIRKVRENFDARVMNNIWNYERYAGMEKYDRPPAVITADAFFFDYHVANHNRPGAAYYFLQDLLGKDLFKKALQEYIVRWHHKHPVPWDFINTFNEVEGEDLGWYWKPWFFEFGYPDLEIGDVIDHHGNRRVLIKKKGNIPIPVKLLLRFEDDSELTIYRTARVWQDGNTVYPVPVPGDKKIKCIELGDKYIPDVDRNNNIIYVK